VGRRLLAHGRDNARQFVFHLSCSTCMQLTFVLSFSSRRHVVWRRWKAVGFAWRGSASGRRILASLLEEHRRREPCSFDGSRFSRWKDPTDGSKSPRWNPAWASVEPILYRQRPCGSFHGLGSRTQATLEMCAKSAKRDHRGDLRWRRLLFLRVCSPYSPRLQLGLALLGRCRTDSWRRSRDANLPADLCLGSTERRVSSGELGECHARLRSWTRERGVDWRCCFAEILPGGLGWPVPFQRLW